VSKKLNRFYNKNLIVCTANTAVLNLLDRVCSGSNVECSRGADCTSKPFQDCSR